MISFEARQSQIEQQKARAMQLYPDLWERTIAEWQTDQPADRAWLIYSASYLFRTAGVRWALDPLTLPQRLTNTPAVQVYPGLDSLSFVLLTHRHADHLNTSFLRSLKDLPIRWVVPEDILPIVLAQAGLPERQVTVPRALEHIQIEGLTILPFDGIHWEARPGADQPPRGVPSMGYLVEFGGKRWLFPGDTRTYDASRLPAFGPVDGVFAHVWLGRGSALCDPPPLIDPFCRFCLSLQPRSLVLAHLQEFGRSAHQFWDMEHAAQIIHRWSEIAPGIPVRAALMGNSVELDP